MAPARPAWLRAIVHDFDVEPTRCANTAVRATSARPSNTTKRASTAARSLPPYDKDLSCKHCGKAFRRVCNYREHQRVHSNEYKFTCAVAGCGRKFMWRSSIQAHNRSHQAKLQRSRARSNIIKTTRPQSGMHTKMTPPYSPVSTTEAAHHLTALANVR